MIVKNTMKRGGYIMKTLKKVALVVCFIFTLNIVTAYGGKIVDPLITKLSKQLTTLQKSLVSTQNELKKERNVTKTMKANIKSKELKITSLLEEMKQFKNTNESKVKELQNQVIDMQSQYQQLVDQNTELTNKILGVADYSKANYWLSLPATTDKAVDVFYLYPTAWQKVSADEPNVCSVDNPMMLIGSKLAYLRQATAFETIGNIYAPYYRQADAAYSLSLSQEEQDKLVGGIPKADAFAAFDYYIKNLNKGRPFILAGHSQGSNILTYLLSEYMKKNPAVYKRMVAAYVIGYSVTDQYLAKNPHLKFAEGPKDTGVIISYNTEAAKVEGNNPVLLTGALCINPITWTRTDKLATAQESLGSIILDKQGKVAATNVKNYADAQINLARGSIICSTADVEKLSPGNKVFGKGVFHSFDYPFYYYNIRENAETRVKQYLSSK
jgi:hypothetical protein